MAARLQWRSWRTRSCGTADLGTEAVAEVEAERNKQRCLAIRPWGTILEHSTPAVVLSIHNNNNTNTNNNTTTTVNNSQHQQQAGVKQGQAREMNAHTVNAPFLLVWLSSSALACNFPSFFARYTFGPVQIVPSEFRSTEQKICRIFNTTFGAKPLNAKNKTKKKKKRRHPILIDVIDFCSVSFHHPTFTPTNSQLRCFIAALFCFCALFALIYSSD